MTQNPIEIVPSEIKLRRRSRVLELAYPDGKRHTLSFEYLRTHSPSAEVQGHGPGQDVLQIAKESVDVTRIDPVGHYAVRLVFSDGHDTGLFTWKYLRELAEKYEANWARYLARLDQIGYQRKPVTPTE